MPEAEKEPVVNRSLIRRMVRLLIYSLLLLFLAAGGLVALLFIYQDEVKAVVIKELNKHLKAEVLVDPENIDLTILKTFPYCSIEFRKVLMLEAIKAKKRDTLLYSDRLNLFFNIRDLWQEKYTVEKIRLKNSVVKIRFSKTGNPNYLFWESASPGQNGSSDSLHFKLASIEAHELKLLYEDLESEMFFSLFSPELKLNGEFSNEHYFLDVNALTQLHEFRSGEQMTLKNKELAFQLKLDVNGDRYNIKASAIRINQVKLALNGDFHYSDKLHSMKLTVRAPELKVEEVFSLLPERLTTRLKDYESKGNAYLQGTYNYHEVHGYKLKTEFGLRNGSIRYIPESTSADQVKVEGRLEMSPGNSLLVLNSFRVQLGKDFAEGHFSIRNFEDLDLHLKSDMNLNKLVRFYPIDTLLLLEGELNLELDCKGRLQHFKEDPFGKAVSLELLARAKDLQVQFKGDEKLSRLPTCTLKVGGGEVELSDCRLLRGKSDLLINGRAPGLFDYLRDKQNPLIIYGELFSENLQLEDLMMKYYSSGEKEAPLIPPNMVFKFDAGIRNFSYGSFRAGEISGNIEVKNQKAITSDLKMKLMEGDAEIDAFFDNSKKGLQVMVQSTFKHINISDLFQQFGNFGQTTLIDKNLKGYASAQLDLSGLWSNSLEPDYNSIRSSCDLLIERGELLGFEPMMQLSKFVEVKDLQHIRFSTLHGQVEIHDQKIFIPKTEIRSNALNLEFWGSHSFNNEIDYHFQLLISELLANRRKEKDNAFGEVVNDPENRRSAFILMTGTVDNPVIRYDKKGLKEKLKKDISEEKRELRALLKEEFGIFKRDSGLVKKKAEPARFELEKPDKPQSKKPLQPKKKEEEEDDF